MNYIGLFGTCGRSKYRERFIKKYESEGIEYFNPQVEDWKPELAEIEAQHLAEDKIILFPVTDEEYSLGSLSEIGFSILNAIKLDNRRDFVVLISQELKDDLTDEVLRKESIRSRALVKQHLIKLRLDNLYLVESLDDMLDISVKLYRSNELREGLSKFRVY